MGDGRVELEDIGRIIQANIKTIPGTLSKPRYPYLDICHAMPQGLCVKATEDSVS